MTSVPPETGYSIKPLIEGYLLSRFYASSLSMIGNIQIIKLVTLPL